MNAKDAIRETIELARKLTRDYVGDLSDAELLLRAVPGMNHIAWQLGHLITAEREMLVSIGADMPSVPSGFAEAHGKEAAASDDPSKFRTKAEYLGLMEVIRAGTLKALSRWPEADFDKPGPEPMRSYAPTIGAVFNLIGSHELMHAGQFVAVRRKLGKPALF